MTTIRDQKRLHLRTGLIAGVSMLAIGIAHAQVDEPETVPGQTSVGGPVQDQPTSETIVVTGSRIRRSELNSGAPVFSLGEQTIEDRAFTNVADLLNESPLFAGSVDPVGDVGAFTAGQNQVDLFDLGTNRTLTLLNGRRLVSSNSALLGGLQVDLNVIPVGLIERTEIVPLTGAATYGADAVAGTVNLILKDDFEGFNTYGQYGVTDEGDGKSYQIGVLGGANLFDGRGNVVFGVEYTQDDGLLRTDRPRYTRNNPNFVNFGQASVDLDGDGVADQELEGGGIDLNGDGSADPVNLVFRDQRVQLFGPGGSVSPTATLIPSFGVGTIGGEFYQFNPSGQLETCEAGETPGESSAFFAQGGTCGVDFFDEVEQLRSPVERFNSYGSVSFDVADNVNFETSLLFANTRGEELVEQGGFQTFAFSGASSALTFSTDNPFLSDQARGIFEDNGLETFALNRFNNDIVNSGGNANEAFVWRVAPILSGEFEAADRDFYWDVGAVYGRSDLTAFSSAGGIIDGRFINAVDARRVDDELLQSILAQDPDDDSDDLASLDEAFAALDSVLPNVQRGDIICGGFAEVAAGTEAGFNEQASGNGITDEARPFLDGCTPINLFGQGAASQAAIDYVTGGPTFSKSENEQTVYTANIGGDVIELPGGMVGFNIGAESRREVSSFQPGLGSSIDITRSAVQGDIAARFTTEEYYGEVFIPLVSPDMNIPLVQQLELNGAYRDQTINLSGPDGTKSELGAEVFSVSGRWQPVDDIQLRATYAEAYRIPDFIDLFQEPTQAFITGIDPCDSRFVGLGPNPEVRRANCEAIGIDTTTFRSTISNRTISAGINSGNSDLQAETNESWSVGAIIEPRWVDGLGIAIDYYNLEIVDAIQFQEFEDFAQTCFDSNAFPNEGACGTFTRDLTGEFDEFEEDGVTPNPEFNPTFGQVLSANQNPDNVAVRTFEGLSTRAFYTFDVNDALGLFGMDRDSDLGGLSFDAFAFYTIEQLLQQSAASELETTTGTFANPKLRGTFDAAYDRGPLRATYRLRWQGKANIDRLEQQLYAVDYAIQADGTVSAIIETETNPRFIHDVGLRYEFNDVASVQFNVRNLFEREPSVLEEAANDFGVDELLGRQFTLRLNATF